ncbi:MBL fold metallo-hydrolase [Candidatus Woesearchaeota archaeon]|nr:MBL fold metallo-hydrolase [Candidatus Woesearchaeota archaeon]
MGLSIQAIGGYGEVGRNCTAVKVDDEVFLLDLGLHMENYTRLQDDEDGFQPLLTKKLLIKEGAAPDITMLDPVKDRVKGIIISHAHLDHVGAVPFMANSFPCDVHGTPFTIAVAKRLVAEGHKEMRNSLVAHRFREVFPLSDKVRAEFIEVTHSTPQTAAVALHTPYGVVLYLNDFKLDDTPTMGGVTDLDRLRQLKPRALIIDTLYGNVAAHTGSERAAKALLERALLSPHVKGKRVLVSSFASHIARLHALVRIAQKMRRKVMFVGRSMAKYLEAAHEVGLSDVIDDCDVVRYSSKARKALSRVADPDQYLFVVTGGMGEPNAVLSRIVDESYIPLRRGDIVAFSNRVIPVPSIIRARERLEKRLEGKGLVLLKDLHVSGHGAGADMQLMLDELGPTFVVPVHSEEPQRRAFKERALRSGIPENRILMLSNGEEALL